MKTVITDPQLNREIEATVAIWFKDSSRKGDRKTVAEALVREGLASLKAKGFYQQDTNQEQPDTPACAARKAKVADGCTRSGAGYGPASQASRPGDGRPTRPAAALTT